MMPFHSAGVDARRFAVPAAPAGCRFTPPGMMPFYSAGVDARRFAVPAARHDAVSLRAA